MCIIITLYSIDPHMEILFLLTLVHRQVRLLGQLEKCTPEAGRDSLFCLRTLQRDEHLSSLMLKPGPSS